MLTLKNEKTMTVHLTPAPANQKAIHPLYLRIAHWINAFGVIVMILSGWRIYNASPLYAFEFPGGFTLGGWLAGALAWHFAAMWLLGINFFVYVVYGLLTGHFRRRMLPLWPGAVLRDLQDVIDGRAAHFPGRYNGAQRAAYVFAILAIIVAIMSGLAIWKPVQLQELTALMGGFETARRVHFFAMVGLVLFIIVHVAFALGVKGVIGPMITGRLGSGK
jgi:thiosulfate reductase cytochrome b subunit